MFWNLFRLAAVSVAVLVGGALPAGADSTLIPEDPSLSYASIQKKSEQGAGIEIRYAVPTAPAFTGAQYAAITDLRVLVTQPGARRVSYDLVSECFEARSRQSTSGGAGFSPEGSAFLSLARIPSALFEYGRSVQFFLANVPGTDRSACRQRLVLVVDGFVQTDPETGKAGFLLDL